MELKDVLVANASDHIWDVFDKCREYILEEDLEDIDRAMDTIEDEEEAEDFFEEELSDYLNDLAPDGYAFGIHAKSHAIGFWKLNPETNDIDLPYEGMVEADEDDEFVEEILPHKKTILEEEDDDGKKVEKNTEKDPEDKPKSGVAQVLDDSGRIVGTTTYENRQGVSE